MISNDPSPCPSPLARQSQPREARWPQTAPASGSAAAVAAAAEAASAGIRKSGGAEGPGR